MASSKKTSRDLATKVAGPIDADAFVNCWAVPKKQEVLIDGDDSFPSIYHRQDRLVGQVLNACTVLHVYEQIKGKASFEAVRPHFMGSKADAQNTFEELRKLPDEEMMKTLVAMLDKDMGPVRLRSHRDLIKEPLFRDYQGKFQRYIQEKEADQQAQEIARKNNEKMAFSVTEKPADPRLSAVNNLMQSTIQIFCSGPKEAQSIQRKMGSRAAEAHDLRDLNRIGVHPVTPQYAADFIAIMRLLNPPKTVSSAGERKEIPRLFEELPEVFVNGYYNQKIFVAMDRDVERAGTRTHDNTAAIAEIKIVPAQMSQAEHLSALLKPLVEELDLIGADIDKPKLKKVPARWAGFEKFYAVKQKAFDKLVHDYNALYDDDHKLTYKLPSFPKDPEAYKHHKTYAELKGALIDLETKIHVAGIGKDNVEWQKQYLETALFQRLCNTQLHFRRDAQRILSQAIPRDDTLSNPWIKKVEDHSGWKASALERELKVKFNTTPGRK